MTDATFTPHDLEDISKRTLDSYVRRAEGFWEGTRNHDVSENVSALLRNITAPAPFTILDFGCGPGRDLITFSKLGHVAIGLEAAAPFVAMARKQSGCEVWEQDFLAVDLPDARFDGIFANASLFHVPTQDRNQSSPRSPCRCLCLARPIGICILPARRSASWQDRRSPKIESCEKDSI